MGPGGLPSLQNCVRVGDPGPGGFDSHAPSPLKSLQTWGFLKGYGFNSVVREVADAV
jgi:hypothetical protein